MFVVLLVVLSTKSSTVASFSYLGLFLQQSKKPDLLLFCDDQRDAVKLELIDLLNLGPSLQYLT